MGKMQSKEFRKRMEVKERNKNNWKNKVKESSVEIEVVQLQEIAQEDVSEKPETMYVKVNKNEQQKIKPIIETKNKETQFSKKTESVFAARDALLADRKRKEEYQKVVFKKLKEMQEENER